MKPSLRHWIAGIATIAIAILFVASAQAQDSAPLPGPLSVRPSRQALWVTNGVIPEQGFVSVFQGAKLKRSGPVKSNLSFLDVNYGGPQAIAFDGDANLWTGYCWGTGNPGALVELTASDIRRLARRHRAPRGAVITGTSLECVRSLQFDAAGNLWVNVVGEFSGTPNILEYSADELTQSGTPAPAATIMSPALSSMDSMYERTIYAGMAFDQAGNLWTTGGVLGEYGSNYQETVVEFTKEQLVSGGNLVPSLSVVVASNDSVFSEPTTIAFDNAGNMWVAYESGGGTGGLQMYAANDLTGTGVIEPAPAVVLTSTIAKGVYTLAIPNGLAVDHDGDLWVANPYAGKGTLGGNIVEFTPDQIESSGSPIPKVVIYSNTRKNNVYFPGLITFGPKIP